MLSNKKRDKSPSPRLHDNSDLSVFDEEKDGEDGEKSTHLPKNESAGYISVTENEV